MMARLPSGILILDKPAGISSAKAVSVVKSALGVKKLGHAGTLDPMATGILICCINSATKLSGFFLDGRKTYDAVMVVGVETDTQDATGQPLKECYPDPRVLKDTRIQAVFNGFTGWSDQRPPVYSALKHKGIPLYTYARRGKPVQKPPKRIHIERIIILDIDLPRIRFSVTCSAGTYIRTLCTDIGRTLGCGGHLTALRRTHSSEFTLDQAIALDRVKPLSARGAISDRIIDMADVLQHIPAATVDARTAGRIRNGIVLRTTDFEQLPELPPDGYLRIISADQSLVAIVSRRQHSERFDYRCILPAEEL